MTYPAQKYLENFYVYFLLSYRHSVKLVVINVRGLPIDILYGFALLGLRVRLPIPYL
jgi:hypothetical protein